MLLLFTLLFSLGFYLVYCSSERAVLPSGNWMHFVRSNRKVFRITGYVVLLFTTGLMVPYFGYGSTVFFGGLLLMTVASLAIILLPVFTTRKKM